MVIVAFDLTDEPSLHHAPKWMEDACANADEPIKFLVGTKKDLLVSQCSLRVCDPGRHKFDTS